MPGTLDNLLNEERNKQVYSYLLLYAQRNSGKLTEKIITVVTWAGKVGEVIFMNWGQGWEGDLNFFLYKNI